MPHIFDKEVDYTDTNLKWHLRRFQRQIITIAGSPTGVGVGG